MAAFSLSPTHRSSIVFVAGMLIAAGTAVSLDGGWKYQLRQGSLSVLGEDISIELMEPQPLTAEDRQAALRAWNYIAANTQASTGLVDSVEGFPSTTLWDQGSYLLALVAAERLEIIDGVEFERRVAKFLDSFSRIPLFEGKLPNKAYDTTNLAMVDYTNTVAEGGIGWSALDVARMLVSFRALEKLRPEYGSQIRSLLARWDLDAMALDGELWGATRKDGETQYTQEGRIGYEQYGARSAALWGMDVMLAASASRVLEWVEVQGVEVPTDIRRADTFGAITPVLSEPFILQAIELGLDSEGRILAERIYQAQEQRYRDTGVATMVSEDHLDRAPYFAYASIYSNGEPWAVVTEQGEFYPELRTQSTKATFAWDALYSTEYTKFLRKRVESIGDPGRGWPAGLYEKDNSLNEAYSLNTNAIVIESIHYKAFGPLWKLR